MVADVQIVGTGARTPVGLQASASAAAVRAGISRLAQHPFMIDHLGDPMPAAMDAQLDASLMGAGRLLALIEPALREACAPLATVRNPLLRLPVYLGLPEIRPGFSAEDAGMVRSGFEQFGGLPIEISEVSVLTRGHASGIAAMALAADKIQTGAFAACLVGGVESYFQPDTMEWLDENRQLATADARSAFVPGEGAGFCLLMTEAARRDLGLEALGKLIRVAVATETKLIRTSDVCLGVGLTEAVQSVVGKSGVPRTNRINAVICDINGERYRCEEWGFVCLRVPEYFDDPTAYLSPADCWGDVGAASGPLFAMLACQAAARGYARGPQTLLWASSEGGLRGAAVLRFKAAGEYWNGGGSHG